MLLNSLVEDWLLFKEVNEGRAESTVKKYRGYITRLCAFLHERGLTIFTADKDSLEEFTGIFLHGEELSPSSRKAVVAAVKGLYAWLNENGHVPEDPARRLVYPTIGRKLPTVMGLHNAERLLMQPDITTFLGLRDAAIISLLLACGMRVSGLCRLNESSLYWFQYEDVDRLAVKLVEKGGHERIVPVDNSAMLLVRAYLGHTDLQAIDRTTTKGEQVLFVSVRNRSVPAHEYRGEKRRLSQNAVWDMIKKHGVAAGLPEEQLHPHAMRHLLGTEMAESDESTLHIQTTLGHADPKTSAIYVQTALRKLTQVMDRSNPLSKISTPVSPLLEELKREGVVR